MDDMNEIKSDSLVRLMNLKNCVVGISFIYREKNSRVLISQGGTLLIFFLLTQKQLVGIR